ncbi:O-antigen ligase family protein [Microbacterium proteolyticum]|uniref:O-antigen ligase family protein n=1 Tax=Microbacterium proteolyticum TaxID=1572644 RepID=UPI001FADA9AB|nr:hypothetical protein [Microbacterium proteolyticum]MCI9857100.1 hypothetical protein [Microbacterium proteolyticum]
MRKKSQHLVARRRAPDGWRLWALFSIVSVAIIGGTAAAIRAIDEPSLAIAALIPAGVVFAVALFVMPVHWLPALTMVILALFPTRFIPAQGPFNALPALAIVLGIWVLRRTLIPDGRATLPLERPVALTARYAVYATGALLVVWLISSVLLNGSTDTSVGWSIAFSASVFVPLLVIDARREAQLLRKTLLVVGALSGLYILGESVLRFSPLYGVATGDLVFSVYRARGAFSHPLFAAAFLTVPALLGLGTWLTQGRRWPLVAGLISAAGVMATVSRGPLAAVAIAVGFAILVSPIFIGWSNLTRWVQLLVVTIVGSIGALNFGPLVERGDSIESRISADVRDRAVDVALRSADYSGFIGTGPGTSGETSRLFDTIIIENSILQLLISIGVPGLLLFLAFIAALGWRAAVTGNLGTALAIIAYVVAISGFNTIDAVRSMHIIIGMLALLAVHGGERLESPFPPSATRTPGPASRQGNTTSNRSQRERTPA